ncbi:MAG TPA: DNA-binding response regulator, partial [Cupriavidus sp.]|nr:DNA-binding response regulator [Cupriavidus sp.]
MTIRILLIDDHTLFRSGVRALLQWQSDFEVVDEAADGVEGIKRAKQHRP